MTQKYSNGPPVNQFAPTSSGPPEQLHPGLRRRAAGRALVVATAGYLLLRVGLATASRPDLPDAAVVAGTVLGVAGAIGLPAAALACLAVLGLPRTLLAALLAGGIALWLGLTPLTGGDPLAGVVVAAVQDLGKITAAGALGLALAGFLREPGILAPAGLFAALADLVVVRVGTVHQALQTEAGRALVSTVSAQVPAVHPAFGGLTIGPADFLFLAFFLGCAARFGMGVRRNAAMLTVVLGVSLLLVPVVGAIPALAPMGIAFVALNWSRFRLTRSEAVSSVVVVALAAALFLGFFLWIGRNRPPAPAAPVPPTSGPAEAPRSGGSGS